MFIQIKVQNVKQVAFKNPSESIKADEGTFMVVAAQPKVSALIPPRVQSEPHVLPNVHTSGARRLRYASLKRHDEMAAP